MITATDQGFAGDEMAFSNFALIHGYKIDSPIADGAIHRFQLGTKKANKDGWYVINGGCGFVGDWVSGNKFTWQVQSTTSMTGQQLDKIKKQQRQHRLKIEAKIKEKNSTAAEKAQSEWCNAKKVSYHPYLSKKKVKEYGLRVDEKQSLLIPVRQPDGRLSSLQRISSDGSKRFLSGGKVAGGSFTIPGDRSNPALLVEGCATGATLHEATGAEVIVAFNAGNLLSVAKQLKNKQRHFIICADDDAFTDGNPGIKKAKEAAKETGSMWIKPNFPRGKRCGGTDFNDLAAIIGLTALRQQVSRIIPQMLMGFLAAEIMDMKLPEPRWAVSGIIPEGLTILGGKPKMGKSIFVLNLAIQIASGWEALCKIETVQGEVIYLALEDTLRRLQTRLRQMSQTENPMLSKLHIYTDWPLMGKGGARALRNELKKRPQTRLVIVDTLKKIRPRDHKKSRNIYDEDYEAVEAIKQVADEYGVAILIVHHLRKSGSDDIMDTFSGSFGLTGAADGMLVLQREPKTGMAILHVNGRDVEAKELALTFDNQTLSWQLEGEASEFQSTETKQQIYMALKDLKPEETMSPNELEKATGVDGQNIRQALSRMVRDGNIEKPARGKYRLPQTEDIPPVTTVTMSQSKKNDQEDCNSTERGHKPCHNNNHLNNQEITAKSDKVTNVTRTPVEEQTWNL